MKEVSLASRIVICDPKSHVHMLPLEKASHHAQEEFREEAAELLKTILEKNDEFGGDRRVSATVWYPNSRLMTFRYFRYPSLSNSSQEELPKPL